MTWCFRPLPMGRSSPTPPGVPTMILFRTTALALGLALPALAVVHAAQTDPDKKKDPAEEKSRQAVGAWLDRTLRGDSPQDRAALAPPHKVEAVDLECVRK